jgi:two-component system, NtrC family, response regulator HydG
MTCLLLVEDDYEVRLVIEQILTNAGFEVEATDSVSGGCDLLDRRSYDLVLTDGKLGDGSGIEIADKAQQLRIPALLYTGYASFLGDGSYGYPILMKPVRSKDLLAAIRGILGTEPHRAKSSQFVSDELTPNPPRSTSSRKS